MCFLHSWLWIQSLGNCLLIILITCIEIFVRIERQGRITAELCSQIPGYRFLLKLRHEPAQHNCCRHLPDQQHKVSVINQTSITHFLGFKTASCDKWTRVRSRLRQWIMCAVWQVTGFLIPTATVTISGTSGRKVHAWWHRCRQHSEHSYLVFWEWGREREENNFARWIWTYAVPPCFRARGWCRSCSISDMYAAWEHGGRKRQERLRNGCVCGCQQM